MRIFFPSIFRSGRLVAALAPMMLCLCSASAAHAQLSDQQRCSALKIVAMGRCYNCLVKEDRRALSGGEADPARCHDKLVDQFSKIDAAGGCGLTGDAEVAYARITSGQSDLVDTFLAEHFAAPDPAACAADQLKAAGQLAKCRAIHRAGEVKTSTFWNVFNDYAFYEACMNVFSLRLEGIWGQADGAACPFPGYDGMDQADSSTVHITGYIPMGDFRDADIGRAQFQFGALAGGDFTNAVFHDTNLEDSDLSGSTFAGASFGDGPLSQVLMNRANLAGADFSSASLMELTAGALVACPAALPAGWVCINNHLLGPRVMAYDYDLSGYDLEGLDLTGAWFDGSDFSGANLRGVTFGGEGHFGDSDFSGADLTNAVIGSVEFDSINLDGANLSGVNLSYFDHSGAHFSARNLAACPAALSANYSCTQGTIFGAWANVDGVDFSGENFTGGSYHHASFVGTTLVGTNFTSAQLGSTYFTGANLTGANLTGANLFDAHFNATTWSATICPDGVLSDAAGGTCCGHHVGLPPAECD